jgi:YVTN family beta-propeller protein
VVGATMFYTMGSGTKVRTLEQDDISWASYGYPSTSYNTTYGSISGNITYGYGGQPVAGAIVYAISTSRQDSVHAYSDAQGNYLVPGLIPGSYYIYIEPLDGNVNGYNLRPGNISPYIYANTIYTDYPGEFYSGTSESSTETTDTKSPVSVSAGKTTQGINLITNKDLTPPFVVKARATDVSGSLINILSNFSIRFSEPVDETTLSTGTCYLSDGTKTYGGSYTVLGDSVNVVMFDPDSVLKYSTVYTLHVTGGVKDLKGNLLQPEFTQSFTTISKDNTPPQVNEVIPANGATNVFITDNIKIFFSEPMNKTSVEKGFTLTDAGVLKTVSGTFNWDTQNMSVIFTPLGSLREGTTYTIRLPNSISDLSGNKMVSSSSVSFTTVPQAAPTISYFGPVYGSTGVPVTTPVVVDFSEPINTYLINSSTFEVFMGTTPVQGTFEFLNENSRVVFRPSSNLNFSQTYTVILTAGIMDVSQPSLSLKNAPITNTFTTAPNATVSDILYLDPASGVAGAEVTIAGSGFDPNPANNTITFNGFSAPVKTATLTTLTTEVPLSATSGPVQVKVNGTASDNTMYFYIIPQSLDPCSNIIANTSTGTKSTHSTDVTPDGAYAYVTNPNEGTVTAVGLNSLQTTSITVGSTPMNIDINPLGTRAYVTNFNSHTVSVIDLVSTSGTYNKVIETIPVGIEPYGIVSTPDGNRVYVANYYSETMSVINVDPSSGGFDHVVANVTTGTKLNNATITPDGAMVLVTGDDGLKIIDSNPKDKDYNGIIANVSSGTKTNGVAVIPDAGLAMITTEEGHVLVVNLHPDNGDYSEAVIANVSTGTKVSDVKASGDAIFVYMTDTNNNQLLVYQIGVGGSGTTNGSAILGLTLIPHNKIPVGNAPKGMVLSAKSDKLYVIDTKASTGNREITTVAICCGPITPAKTIGDLIISIQNMINNGNITKLRGYALIVTLNSALRNINANRPNLAILDLTAFNVLVNTYIKNKQITSAQGNALVISATALINQLKGTKSALSEPSLADTAQVNQGLIPVSRLGVIYPNPFSQTITINYNVAEKNEAPTKVQIMIYDINGKLVESLVDEIMQSGCYTASWNGTYGDGTHAPYGTYFVLFRAGNVVEVGKIMLIKPR